MSADFWDVITPDLVESLDDWNRNIPQRGETVLTATETQTLEHHLVAKCQSVSGLDDKIRKAVGTTGAIDWATLIATLLPIILQLISSLFPPKPAPPAPVPPAPVPAP